MNSQTIIVADSDAVFQRTLVRALEKRGHTVIAAATLAEARHALTRVREALLVTDIRFPDGNGLDLLEDVRSHVTSGRRSIERSIVLTSYGSVAGAVAAAKLGAADYLAKPSDAVTIEAALFGQSSAPADRIFARPDEIEFRYLLTVFEQHDRNMSETARAIGMHRRTLQRILRRRGIAPATKMALEHPDERQRMRRLYRLWTHLLAEDKVPNLSAISRDSVPVERST
jgi:two-component system, response regulator RegA